MNIQNLLNNDLDSIYFEIEEQLEVPSDERNLSSSLSDRDILGSIEQFSSGIEKSSLNGITLEEAISDFSFDFFENAEFPADDLEPSLTLPTYSNSTETTGTEDSTPVQNEIKKFDIEQSSVQTSAISIPTLLPKSREETPKKHKRWTDGEILLLKSLYDAGFNNREIARELNRTVFSCNDKIAKLVRKKILNKDLRKIKNKVNRAPEITTVISQSVKELQKKTAVGWNQSELDELVLMYNQGLTFTEIGEQLNRTRDSIDSKVRWLKRQNMISTRNRPKPTAQHIRLPPKNSDS